MVRNSAKPQAELSVSNHEATILILRDAAERPLLRMRGSGCCRV
jgi:hypothetical protein